MKWVLVDFSYVAHRARYHAAHIAHEQGANEIVFECLDLLHKIGTDPKVRSNKILIFCDTKQSHRSDFYPEYKSHRREERTPEEIESLQNMYRQMNLLKDEIFPLLGFPAYSQRGLESDDLIAYAAQELSKRKEKSVIITSDGDLFQCINAKTHWYDPQRQLYYTAESFAEDKNITPKQWAAVKVLHGCPTDGVRGVPGVGEKKAIDYIKKTLPETHKAHQNIISENGRAICTRNEKLVCLPHEKTEQFCVQEPEYDFDKWIIMCEKEGFEYFLSEPQFTQWRRFFEGTAFPQVRKREYPNMDMLS